MPLPTRTLASTPAEHLTDHNAMHAAYGTAGGAATLPLDIVPTTPHAKDDEFTGTSLDAKWTAPVTSTRAVTTVVANDWLSIRVGDAGATRGGYGIRQASPAGSFTVSAKIASNRTTGAASDAVAGLFVGRLTATAKANVLGVQTGYSRFVEAIGTTYSHTADWPAFDGFEANVTPEDPGPRWVRISWDTATTTLSFFYSGDGVDWTRLTTRTAMQQPEFIGLVVYGNTSVNADRRLAADWFRVTEP